jgi:choline dehydrogenase-like flavoprotein
LTEAGGFEYDTTVQSLYDGESAGHELADPLHCRLRYFGGTTNHWQGWCAPLKESDFATRSWVPHSGWPISKADLDPFYEAAQPIFELGLYRYEAGQLPGGVDLPKFDAETLRGRYWHYSPPTRFGMRYRETLANADNVEVVLNANVVGIQTNATATEVEALQLRTLDGRVGSVRARIFVLACGALENARLLLQARDVEPNGLGNRSGALGRFFMQHPERLVGEVATNEPDVLLGAFDERETGGSRIRAHITTSVACEERFQLLNAGFDVRAMTSYGTGYTTLRSIVHDVSAGKWPATLDAKILSILTDMDNLAGDVYRRVRGQGAALGLIAHSEQAPNPESRVTLSDARDRFGIPKLRVNWRLTANDKRSLRESTLRVGEELARLKLGRIKLDPWILEDDASWPDPIWGGCHHMGTTRMSDEPSNGVVDRDCRVNGVGNLYVAGSSVFPTGGYATPTLTLVALALRLADHVRGGLGA